MATVRTLDGLKYGFKLLGLSLAVLVVGGLLVGIGGIIASTGLNVANPAQSDLLPAVAGGFVALIGLLWLYGASLGLLHKLVADSVATGVRLSGGEDRGTTGAADNEQSADDVADETTAVGSVGTAGDDSRSPISDPEPTTTESAEANDDLSGSGPWDDDTAENPVSDSETAESDVAEADIGTEPSGEELDRVVSEATEPTDDEFEATENDRDPVEEDTYGAGAADRTGEAYDDQSGDDGADETGEADAYGTDPQDDYVAETDPEAVEADETAEDVAFEDIEDTTDEPGDWEPLDEDDL